MFSSNKKLKLVSLKLIVLGTCDQLHNIPVHVTSYVTYCLIIIPFMSMFLNQAFFNKESKF